MKQVLFALRHKFGRHDLQDPVEDSDILLGEALEHPAHDRHLIVCVKIHVCIVFFREDQMIFAPVNDGVLAFQIALLDEVIDFIGGV
jgi:hypothetical protein